MKKLFLLVALLVLIPVVSAQIPGPVGYVNDFAGVLGSDTADIENIISGLEDETGAEIAVVTIQKLPDGYDMLTYGVELFNNWGIGKSGADNGLLILLSIEDKKWRIEVGYGLEPIINDAKAGRIGRSTLENAFENGTYGKEVKSAVLMVSDEILSARETGDYFYEFVSGVDPIVIIIIVIILVIAIVLLALTGNIWLVWIIVRLLLMLLTGGRSSGFGGGKSGGGGAGNIYNPRI